MVGASACALIMLAGLVGFDADPGPTLALDQPGPVRSAFRKTKYPWYDESSDSARPVWPPKEWDLSWLDRWFARWKFTSGSGKSWGLPSLGELIAIGLILLALTILLIVLLDAWRRYRPIGLEFERNRALRGEPAARMEGLPEGVRPRVSDPWAEAERLRERGDYAGAIVCLFAHELLTLDRIGQVQLIPGRTGRQLVRAIADRQLRDSVVPTLRLFEAVYYGHRTPSAEAFEAAWSHAEAFQRRVAEGVAS